MPITLAWASQQGRRTRRSLMGCLIRARLRKMAGRRLPSASPGHQETRSTSAARTTGALPGMVLWDQLRARLVGDGEGRAMIVTFSTCADSIRTVPFLQHDPDRP